MAIRQMKYTNYTTEDFVLDEYFQRWVKTPDQENELFWETWLAAHPHKREMVEEARQTVLELKFTEHLPTQDQFTQVWQKINQENDSYDYNQTYKKRVRNLAVQWAGGWQKVAAVFIGILIMAAALFYTSTNSVISYKTQYGETQTITLPDGSTVILNSNSRLSFSPRWDAQSPREIWLQGEAFFSVTHTKNHQKFLVHPSDNFQIEVVGTEFNVYQRRSATRVVLNAGKVKINIRNDEEEKEVEMKPGELVELSKNAEGYIKKKVNPQLFSAWTAQELIFSDTPVSEIFTLLEETYGLEIITTDKEIYKRKLSGSVPSDNLESLLFALSESLHYHILKQENRITFHKKAAN
jgi:ferric-dicitrate binding protein FerR (iron transport regulator)